VGPNQAMVADLVPPERHEAAYASVRVASNLGVVCGPPVGGLLLIGGH
jgi:predicted MFS family arabinose efflux permease